MRAVPVVEASRSVLPLTRLCRIDIVSGSFGAGHDSAAREIAVRLRADGYLVRIHDVVDFFPVRLGRALRAAYLWQLRFLPRSWRFLLAALSHESLHCHPVRRLLSVASRALRRAVSGSDLVISTHPFASQIAGELRRRRRLTMPVFTYLTDASVHPVWVHPSVDLHLAWHPVGAAQAAAHHGITTVIEPLVPRPLIGAQMTACERAAFRTSLGVHPDRPVALIVGGSLGIGALEQSASDVLATGLAQPVVLCGTNKDLLRRVGSIRGAVALEWRDDLPRLFACADVVIQNAGGFTSLEAMAARVPVLSFRCVPGHGESNAAALHDSGMAPWVRDRSALATVLASAISVGRAGADRVCRPTLLDIVGGGSVHHADHGGVELNGTALASRFS